MNEIITNESESNIVQLDETSNNEQDVLLEVKNLKTQFFTEEGVVKAVDGISFKIFKDEVVGLVGETGCGKSVTALSILRLVRDPGKIINGEVLFNGLDLLKLSEKEMRAYRGNEITMIFQDPLNSLNPVFTVGKQLNEVFELHQEELLKDILDKRRLEKKNKTIEYKQLKKKIKNEKERLTEEEIIEYEEKIKRIKKEITHYPNKDDVLDDKGAEILKETGIADERGILNRYPHELSGGMRQRVMIAMALSCNPKLLIADEPTTALDVTIQAQILELMQDLKKKFKTSILFITHDLGVIAEICDRVTVMYSGSIVEYAPSKDLFKNPRHPYTQGLIDAIPTVEKRDTKLKTIRGMVPNLIYPPSGCRFHPRCSERLEICDKVKPRWIEIEPNYFISCHLFDDEYKDSPKYEWKEEDKEESFLV